MKNPFQTKGNISTFALKFNHATIHNPSIVPK